jgi:hypothetical protein
MHSEVFGSFDGREIAPRRRRTCRHRSHPKENERGLVFRVPVAIRFLFQVSFKLCSIGVSLLGGLTALCDRPHNGQNSTIGAPNASVVIHQFRRVRAPWSAGSWRTIRDGRCDTPRGELGVENPESA